MNRYINLIYFWSKKFCSKKICQVKTKILLIIIIPISEIFSAGYIYVSDNFLGKNLITDSVSIGLGNNSCMIDSLFVMKTNPSELSETKNFVFEINYGFYNVDERIVENKNKLQKNNFSFVPSANFGVYYPIELKSFIEQLGFGFGYFPEYETNYSNISETKNFKVSGGIDSIVFPIVIGTKMFSIGFGLKSFLGSQNVETNTEKNNFNITGTGYVLSLRTKIADSNFCLSYTPKTELKYKSSSTEIKSGLPEKIVFGFKQNFGDETSQPSNINFELDFFNYSRIEKDSVKLNYNDVITTSIGVEKYIAENVVLRLGFFYEPSYVIKGSVITGVSTGFSYIWNKIQLNLGLSYSKENYYGDGNIFSTKIGIDESYTLIVFGMKYKM